MAEHTCTDEKLEDVEIADDHDQTSSNMDQAARPHPTKRTHLAIAMVLIVAVVVVIAVPTAVVKSRDNGNTGEETRITSKFVRGPSNKGNGDGDDDDDSPATVDGSSISPSSTTAGRKSSLPSFGKEIIEGYKSLEDLEADIASAGDFVLNQVVKRNLKQKGYGNVGFGRANPNAIFRDNAMPLPEMDASGPGQNGVTNTVTGGGSDVAGDLTDYGTNNQEDNVEEGDLVVSDGNLLYTAYGDYVVVVDPRTGADVVKFEIPAANDDGNTQGFPSTGGGPAFDIMPIYRPQPAVRSLLVHEASKRLLVVADGYASKSIQERADTNSSLPIIYEYLGTHIRVYDTDALAAGNTEPLSTKNVHGGFNAVRVIDNVAHLMTVSGVDTYSDLIEPFERYNYPKLSDAQYRKKVKRISGTAVTDFTDKLMDDLLVQAGSLPNLARISLYTESSNKMAELTLPNGPMNSYAQIASFDITGDSLDMSLSGAFIPDYFARFYGATNSLIIAGQGSRFLENKDASGTSMPTSIDTTYFLSFSFDGSSVAPHSVGKVDGFLVNVYAIDVVDDMLRVAVTIRENTWWCCDMPVEEPLMPVMDENNTKPVSDGNSDSRTSSGGRGGRVRALQNNGIAVGEPNPSTPAPDDGGDEDESSTENYLIVLQMPGSNGTTAGEMIERGRVKMGKPNESITTVRFFDDIAFAVTFEQRDPFYVLDVSDPSAPAIVGELDISGFSSYLLPMNDDNSMMLAIGQEADSNGTVIGMQLTVFDVTELSDPQVLHRLVLENSKTTQSWSDALWDFKASRYAGGRLIIPIDIYDWNNNSTDELHGFIVFKADETGIEEECRINQGSNPMYVDMCYYCAQLPRRSMIFDGDLVTLNDHFITSTDMQSCSSNWETLVTVDKSTGGDEMGCCGRW